MFMRFAVVKLKKKASYALFKAEYLNWVFCKINLPKVR